MTRLVRLVQLLIAENQRQNLVSASSLGAVWQRHIADSAQLLDFVPRGTEPWLDLGTGAGFPGLVISAMRPDWPVVLVESRSRRVDWLRGAIEQLELSFCTVEGRKLEDVTAFPAGVISARAFAPLPRLIASARRFSTSDTYWLLPKGRSAAQEVAELPSKLQAMFHVEQSATGADSGIVIGQIVDARR
jgi:16S rRNA (guanine527-N7)-methyltransferase